MSEHKNYPKHVGIILDGNRRFAKRLNLDPWKGHEYGEKKLEKVLAWSQELEIKELTVYSFSIQNFNRPKMEFDYLMKIFKAGCKELLRKQEEKEQNIKVRFVGRTHLFPQNIQDLIKQVEEKTAHNEDYILNIAFGYGGKEELTDAIKELAIEIKAGKIEPEDIDESMIQEHLYLQSEPDLIIRTGGEKRTSNFLMWQSSYSEWLFLDKPWPEFEKEDLIQACDDYAIRERRFGK